MPSLKRHRLFKKDEKRVRLADSQFESYAKSIYHLMQGIPLPAEFKDHELLGGEWRGYREYHIGGDMLVIYKEYQEEDQIVFVRMGTHSELFG